MFSLERRRLRDDLIDVNNIIRGLNKVNRIFFPWYVVAKKKPFVKGKTFSGILLFPHREKMKVKLTPRGGGVVGYNSFDLETFRKALK